MLYVLSSICRSILEIVLILKSLKIDTHFIPKPFGKISAQYMGLLWPDAGTKYVWLYLQQINNSLTTNFKKIWHMLETAIWYVLPFIRILWMVLFWTISFLNTFDIFKRKVQLCNGSAGNWNLIFYAQILFGAKN